MSTYEELSIERKKEQDKGNLPNWFTTSAYQLIKKNYLWKDSTLKETYQRMADTAIKHLEGKLPVEEVEYIHKRFFEILWNGDLAAASPVFNLGTPRGMPVSCSGGMVKDSVSGFYEHRLESALLCKLQFGTSGYLGRIRPRGAPIGPGGTAAGAAMVFKGLFQDTQDITQGTLRRGSYGAYIDQNGGDFEEIMDIMFADPEGKNLGVNYYDKDVKSVLTNDENNVTFNRWRKHMKLRALYGKGYFYFVDRVARLQPPMYDPKPFDFEFDLGDTVEAMIEYDRIKLTVQELIDTVDKGTKAKLISKTETLLDVDGYKLVDYDKSKVTLNTVRRLRSLASNLCSEITIHADELHTYSCVLSSMNAARFDEWKDTDAVYIATIFLDCVNEELIKLASKVPHLENVVRGAKKGRPLGLGLLGFHTYLQENSIPFESVEAIDFNETLFSHLKSEATRASKYLAKHLGEPEWCEGYGLRNTHLLACAPNTSSALICSGVSQGIEPLISNVYMQKMAGGTVSRVSPTLLKLMKERGVYCQDLIDKIGIEFDGSVQDESIDWLSPHEKLVFKTAYEIDQKTIIDLAADRQKYVCQAQSINMFFKGTAEEYDVADVTQYAMANKWIKSLYYQRSQAKIKSSTGKAEKDSGECVSCEA